MRKLPAEVLELRGAFKHDPQRRRPPAPKSTAPLGEPPPYFQPDERATWFELRRLAPWLAAADRWVVEIASLLMAKLRRREALSNGELSKLLSSLSLIGATPADRQRLSIAPEKDEPSAFAEFAQFLS